MKKAWLGLAAVALLGSTAFAGTVDFVFVVDESGSMSAEHTWLGTMITDLNAAIVASGNTGQYGLLGYGSTTAGHGVSEQGHIHTVGGGQFGTAAQFATATGGLVASGATEDGWQAISAALSGYTFAAGHAVNIVLITDEDRDVNGGPASLAALEALLDRGALPTALLNAVINWHMMIAGNTMLGVDSHGVGYLANGSGGYTTATGAYSSAPYEGSNVTTQSDYVVPAWYTGGAAWDLSALFSGNANTINSFTKAFVDIKVQEVVNQLAAPLPSAAWAGLSLLGGLGVVMRSRRRKSMDLS